MTPDLARTMAAYNRWQNDSLYGAASGLDDTARRADRGAFFGSIQATLTHLLWGDRMWMHRFAATPKATRTSIEESVMEVAGWAELVEAREAMDRAIVAWAHGLDAERLAGSLTWYSGALGREVQRPLDLLVAHFFNHQTHHRGQVHAMLTAAGAKPADTDLFAMPQDWLAWPQ
jgi:uncharacterized damage-inducible protein DinB